MDIFGPQWSEHVHKLTIRWDSTVDDNDLIIVAGDISWAMTLAEAAPDFNWLSLRKGTKLLIRGNHDYWWSSIGKLRAALPKRIYALQNDHFDWEGWSICGSRGWICPGDNGFDSEQDQKIYLREAARLEMSLKSAVKQQAGDIIAVLHFPPFNRQNEKSVFTELLERYSVKICVFGHIHDQGRDWVFQGLRGGVSYRFAAADGIGFTPLRLV